MKTNLPPHTKPSLTIICAIAENGAIGNKQQLLYYLPADLRRFKALTTGHTIIMGRRTFESLPKGALPNRRNIVLTRDAAHFEAPGVEAFPSLQEALAACAGEQEVFIIGGHSVYESAMPWATCLQITHVHATPEEADTYFPAYAQEEWHCEHTERHEADEKHAVPYTFATYRRHSAAQNELFQ